MKRAPEPRPEWVRTCAISHAETHDAVLRLLPYLERWTDAGPTEKRLDVLHFLIEALGAKAASESEGLRARCQQQRHASGPNTPASALLRQLFLDARESVSTRLAAARSLWLLGVRELPVAELTAVLGERSAALRSWALGRLARETGQVGYVPAPSLRSIPLQGKCEMRVLKIVGLGLLGLVAVLVVVGLFLPRQWRVERTVVIKAGPEHIHPLVNELKEWQSWAAWTKAMDPEVKHEYGGPASGVGAWWSWNGPVMGHGKMTIVKSDVASGVWIDEMIETDDAVNAKGALTWTQEGEDTKVKWVDEGTLPPVIGGYAVSFIETMLGDNFKVGLENLKVQAEKRRAASASAPAPAMAEPAAP